MYDIDFRETFSPVVEYATIQVISTKKLKLVQFDVKTAFIYGDLEEGIEKKDKKIELY